jgi:hypothetical protein
VVPLPKSKVPSKCAHGGAHNGVCGSPASSHELEKLLSPLQCAGFEWAELSHAPHGPFGAISGSENLLHANGFSNRSSLPAIMTATSCCFASDLSFPTVWYDFDSSDAAIANLSSIADAWPWHSKKQSAFFRGSIYWFEKHGRTRAFARSLVAPSEIDVDWYENIETASLETDGTPHFGDMGEYAGHKFVLSLEGHSFWSFRLRQLAVVGSAVLHQDLPCHEFWHALLRPYEHYLPLRRDLKDLRAQLRYARDNDAATKRMALRMRKLAVKLLSRRTVLRYTKELLVQYSLLQKFPVTLHRLASPAGL